MLNHPLPEPDTDGPPPQGNDTAQTTEPHAPPPRPARRPGLPAWTVGLLILALTAALVWAGNAYIRSRQQRREQEDLALLPATATPGATRAPTATAAQPPRPRSTTALPAPTDAGPTPILLADLHPTERTEQLYAALVTQIEQDASFEAGQVRVERLGRQVETDEAARAAGQESNARYVLWSGDTGQGTGLTLQRIGPSTRTNITPQEYELTLSEPERLDLCAFTGAPGELDPATYAVLATAAYDRKQYDAAAAYWNRAIDAASEQEGCELDAGMHLNRANALAFGGDVEAALLAFDAALELDGRLALAYANRGSLYAATGDDAAAVEDLNQALDIDPEIANAYYARATVHQIADRFEAALSDLDRALELDPQHARAYARRGLIHHNTGDHEAALNDYARALELVPGAADVYLNRGGTYATLGRLEDALADYDRALELDPDDADAYYNRGTVHAMLEQYEQALVDLDRALEIRPGFAQVYGNRGIVYKAMGDTERAIADLERFLEMSDNPEWRAAIEQQLAELKGE